MKNNISKLFFLFCFFSSLVIAFSLGTYSSKSTETKFLQIGTGSIEGTYYPVGRTIANMISHPPDLPPCKPGQACGVSGLIAVAKSTEGSIDNILKMKQGQIQSALSQADIAHFAYLGKGYFEKEGAAKSIRAIAHLYTETVHIVVANKAKIAKISDLKGKRVSLGKKNSGTLTNALFLIHHAGKFSEKQLKEAHYISSGQAADLMREDKLDAFFLTAGFPVEVIGELVKEGVADILSIDARAAHEIQKNYPYFGFQNLPENIYGTDGERHVLTISALWLIDATVDEKLVYEITKSLWHEDNRKKLIKGHPQGLSIKFQRALVAIGIPLHPGAKKYYDENPMQINFTPWKEIKLDMTVSQNQ